MPLNISEPIAGGVIQVHVRDFGSRIFERVNVIFLIGNEKAFNFARGSVSLKNQYPTHFPITLK
jgi:hypothetical protein